MGKTEKLVIIFSLFFPFLCSFTRMDFDSILLGTSAIEIVEKYGQPYAIHDRNNGSYEYEYIEKFTMNDELVYENHYFLKIVEGKVAEKRIDQETQPGYDSLWQVDPNYPSYP